jgi:plasmid stability protein
VDQRDIPAVSTDSRDILILVSEHTNVTLSLPSPLLRRFRIYAAKHNRSMTALMSDAISKMVDEEGETGRAERRILERLRNPPGRLTGGKITWTREDVHER